jgi:hypothetical protein
LWRSRGRYHRLWIDPLAAWVDLEPPLAAAGSGPAMAVRVGPCRGAARRRRVHPSAGARAGERAHDGAVGANCGTTWGEEDRMNPRVRTRASAWFCSVGFHAWPLDADGRLTIIGRSHGPGGKRISRPRPTTRPGTWSALCASGPIGRFQFWAGFEL